MSILAIREALEIAVSEMRPKLSTAYENQKFTPVVNTPYQQITILFATPVNSEYGSTHQENGILQFKLLYPLKTGSADIFERAELIRTTFYRGATFTKDGVNVVIDKTPEVSPGGVDGDRFSIDVKVRFFANIL